MFFLVVSFSNVLQLICLHTFKLSQVLLSNTNLFNIKHLFAHSKVVSHISNTNSFICTQLNGFKY